MVALLLDKGADVAATNEYGWTALHWAAQEGHKDVVALLLDKGADVAATDEYGWTALHWAAQGGHKDVVALLLDKGADVAATDKMDGRPYIGRQREATRTWSRCSWTRAPTSPRRTNMDGRPYIGRQREATRTWSRCSRDAEHGNYR